MAKDTLSGRKLFQHLTHFLMYRIDRLQRTQHHLEFDNLASLVKGDDINAIYHYSIYLTAKLQDSVVSVNHFLLVLKAILKYMHCTCQVHSSDIASLLGSMHNRR